MPNQPTPRKPNCRFYCPKCKADTPHYLRASGESALCLACGDERPVKHLVQALPVNRGGPERHLG